MGIFFLVPDLTANQSVFAHIAAQANIGIMGPTFNRCWEG